MALLLADWEEERVPRNSHGIPLSEATDPQHQYEWDVPLPKRDYAEQALAVTKSSYEKAFPSEKHLDTMIWSVRRSDSPTSEVAS